MMRAMTQTSCLRHHVKTRPHAVMMPIRSLLQDQHDGSTPSRQNQNQRHYGRLAATYYGRKRPYCLRYARRSLSCWNKSRFAHFHPFHAATPFRFHPALHPVLSGKTHKSRQTACGGRKRPWQCSGDEAALRAGRTTRSLLSCLMPRPKRTGFQGGRVSENGLVLNAAKRKGERK